jgi:3-(methylthio)propanoyl-CoA dehydrogenase
MRFTLCEIVGLDDLARLPGWENAAPDLVDAALEGTGKLAGAVLTPLNAVGDKQRALLENGVVRPLVGLRDAYTRYVEAGWKVLTFDSRTRQFFSQIL